MNSRAAGLGRAAAMYAHHGWPAFVLSATKAPVANCARCRDEHVTAAQMEACQCLLCHGFYASTTDQARLAEMIRLHPRGLLAVRTGEPSGSVVVDVDPDGLPGMRELIGAGRLPRTTTQQTGRGGYHLLYGHPGGVIRGGAGKGGPGIDIKADGGYIVVSPSIHPQTRRPYQWLTAFADRPEPLPDWWISRLRPPPPPVRPLRPPVTPGGYAGAALRNEAAAVATAGAGSRNDQLNKSAFALGQLVGAEALDEDDVTSALMAAAAESGLAGEDGPRQCESTIRSGLRAGRGCPRVVA